MEYIYATLTLNELGEELNEDNITAVLETAGADVTESRVKAIVAALEDVDLDELGQEAGVPPAQAPDAAGPGATDSDREPTDEAAPADDQDAMPPEEGGETTPNASPAAEPRGEPAGRDDTERHAADAGGTASAEEAEEQ